MLETAAGLVSVTTGWVEKPSTNLLTHILPQGEEGGGKGIQTALDQHWLQTQHRKASSSHGDAHQVCQDSFGFLSALHPLHLLIFKEITEILGNYKDTLKVRLSSGDYFFRQPKERNEEKQAPIRIKL